ncbi:hypothetical protein INR49_022075 [Caranx melampygus]|nr:hypothetical protein INR49_022075 [Caranx melampygus]
MLLSCHWSTLSTLLAAHWTRGPRLPHAIGSHGLSAPIGQTRHRKGCSGTDLRTAGLLPWIRITSASESRPSEPALIAP